MNTIRRLQGVSYWLMQDPDEIADFININVRKEWETDATEERRNVSRDPWLQTLYGRAWSLELVRADQILLNPHVMNFVDPERRYRFRSSLERRTKELRAVIEKYGCAIWPIIVRREDMMLVDGYCRLATLKEMGISQVYAYLGSLQA